MTFSLFLCQTRSVIDGRPQYFCWAVLQSGSQLEVRRECLGDGVDDGESM